MDVLSVRTQNLHDISKKNIYHSIKTVLLVKQSFEKTKKFEKKQKRVLKNTKK